jgi:hypothetical protein
MMRTLLLGLLLAGCSSSTGTDGANVDVRGTWTFAATQVAPALEITGELRIERQDGATLSGVLETRERAVDGTIRNRVGSLSGRVVASAVDFDVFADAQPRRHVGRVRNDSITGTWAQTSAATPVTGAFTAYRVQR